MWTVRPFGKTAASWSWVARNEEVDRVAAHVLAEARNARRAAAQHRVGLRRAVGGDDVDRLLAVDVAVDFPEDVEQPAIHRRRILAAPVAKMVVELFQRLFVVATVALEGDGEIFAGVGVVEREGARFIQRRRILHRGAGRNKEQGGQTEPQSDPRNCPHINSSRIANSHVHSRERESRKTPPVARHGGRDESNLSSGRLIEIYPSPRTHQSDPIGVGFEYGKKAPPGNLLINQG
jgi:hypothetical protein